MSIDETMQDTIIDSFYLLPAKGDANILVIPIEFPDDPFSSIELDTINSMFFDDNESSLKSFYYQSSYGNLNIDGNVLDPYTASYDSSFYEYWSSPNNSLATGVDLLIEEVITYYL